MRISITDDYQNVIRGLDCFDMLDGHDVTILHDLISDEDKLVTALNAPEAIVLNRTRTAITPSLLSKLPDLKYISQTGKNAGHIDVAACEQHGVAILEGRGNPVATAELTWLLIMNGLRQLPQAIQGMKEGRWQVNMGRRVKGKKIGIWSYGRIGKLVANYAKAFGAEVIIWGGEESRERAKADGYEVAESKSQFFSNCDVVSLHLRLAKDTIGIVKEADLKLMKDDALIVNTSRYGLFEQGALLRCLELGRPGFAALDVYDDEPITDASHLYLQMSNVICTPHLGYVEKDSYELYFGIAFKNLIEAISQG